MDEMACRMRQDMLHLKEVEDSFSSTRRLQPGYPHSDGAGAAHLSASFLSPSLPFHPQATHTPHC